MRPDTTRTPGDRGVAMVGYALVVVLVALVGAVALQTVGSSTSDTFEEVASSMPSDGGVTTTSVPLTPDEKWELAKQDYDTAIAEAKAKKKSDLAQINADYKAATTANKSLPKDERKAANKTAKQDRNDARGDANDEYKSTVNKAKKARDDAKAEWKATK